MTQHHDDWRELGQQLRVDSIRSSSAANSGHPTSSMSAADLMAVLIVEVPALRLRHAGRPAQRPPDLQQGARVAAALRDLQGRGRDQRRGDADLPAARLADRGSSDPGPAVGRRRDRVPRPGTADRRRRCAMPAKKLDRLPARVWCLCGDSEMAEGSMWEAFEAAGHQDLDNLDRHHRRQPSRPDRRDDARLGSRRVPPAGRGLRLEGDRGRRARCRGDRRRATPRPWRRAGGPP